MRLSVKRKKARVSKAFGEIRTETNLYSSFSSPAVPYTYRIVPIGRMPLFPPFPHLLILFLPFSVPSSTSTSISATATKEKEEEEEPLPIPHIFDAHIDFFSSAENGGKRLPTTVREKVGWDG